MAYRTRTHLSGDDMTPFGLTPKHLSKQAFGKRLYNLMLKRGWNQSDLGRHSGLSRDRISTYVRGQTFPTPVNLQAMANALGVTPEELLPNQVESAIDSDIPSVEFRESANEPGKGWLRVNRYVRSRTATQIMTLLNDDDVLGGKP